MSFASPLSSHLAVENFKPLMTTLADRSSRSYTKSLALSMKWADDDTGHDVKNFQGFLQALGLSKAAEYTIPNDSKMPGWNCIDQIVGLVRQALSTADKTIVFIHYTGHAFEKNSRLQFCNGTRQKFINVNFDFLDLLGERSGIDDSANVDIVFVFDACYSSLATRTYTGATRVVEVLAAVDDTSETALSAGPAASFSGKLVNEVISRRDAGAKSVELAELIAHLRKTSPTEKPSYRVLVGSSSLRFPLPGNQTEPTCMGNDSCAQNANWHNRAFTNNGRKTTVYYPLLSGTLYQPPGPATYAVFGFRLAKSLSKDSLMLLKKWIQELTIGLTLESAYETQSMYLIFRAPWTFWSKLSSYAFVQFLCETEWPSLV